jgi:hypothetical protein
VAKLALVFSKAKLMLRIVAPLHSPTKNLAFLLIRDLASATYATHKELNLIKDELYFILWIIFHDSFV